MAGPNAAKPVGETSSTTTSMLDQILFPLSCRHLVVLGRLEKSEKWVCEDCGKSTDFSCDPYKTPLAEDLNTARQIDLQAKQRGETIRRLG
jgi:hypothetical protein